jgi:hypothetical protein
LLFSVTEILRPFGIKSIVFNAPSLFISTLFKVRKK